MTGSISTWPSGAKVRMMFFNILSLQLHNGSPPFDFVRSVRTSYQLCNFVKQLQMASKNHQTLIAFPIRISAWKMLRFFVLKSWVIQLYRSYINKTLQLATPCPIHISETNLFKEALNPFFPNKPPTRETNVILPRHQRQLQGGIAGHLPRILLEGQDGSGVKLHKGHTRGQLCGDADFDSCGLTSWWGMESLSLLVYYWLETCGMYIIMHMH